MKVYNIGSLNVDHVYRVAHFVRPGETLSSLSLELFPGGKGLNQSVALAKAGVCPIHGGRIGSDGRWLRQVLRDAGADVRFVEEDPAPTGHAIIQIDDQGQNCILLFPGANQSFSRDFLCRILADAQPGDLLLLQNEINGLDLIFSLAREKGLVIAFNPSPFRPELTRLPLEQVGWWLCNEVEGGQLTGKTDPEEIADAMLRRFPDSSILLTLGKDGCIFRNQSLSIHQPIFKVPTVDTTAAGDTFTGFFLASVARGEPIAQALRLASAASALAVSRMGASCSIPTMEETLQFLRKD